MRILDFTEYPLSKKHKEFYKSMIQNRYEKILRYSYEKLKDK